MPSLDFIWLSPKAATRYKQQDSHRALSYHTTFGALGAKRSDSDRLDQLFFAVSDPVRRSILERLDGHNLLVSEIAASCAISLQAVSRHIQVLARAGLVTQARTGRISRCSLDASPIAEAAAWINRYSKYWDSQFKTLAHHLLAIENRRSAKKP